MPTKKPKDKPLNVLAPHSIEAEKGLLSSMLQSPDIATKIIGIIGEGDIFIPAHQVFYEEIKADWEKGKATDVVLLTQRMIDTGQILMVGGAVAISELSGYVSSPSNYKHYIEIIKEKAVSRRALEICTAAAIKLQEEQDVTKESLAELQADIGLLKPWIDIPPRTLMDDVHDKLDRMETGEPSMDVIRTGLERLDYYSPLHKGDMPIITGLRKSGKSSFALTILENICITGNLTGLYFSLETPRSEVIDRIFAGISRIPLQRHHHTLMSEEEKARALRAAEKIGAANLIVRDDIFDLHAIVAEAKHIAVMEKNLSIIVVDYAQLVRGPTKKNQNREQEVAGISRALRLLSMELKVPLLLLSQLNTDGATRESRSLEQDCTACWQMENQNIIDIPYQRNGISGIDFPVTFIGELARVENYVEERP